MELVIGRFAKHAQSVTALNVVVIKTLVQLVR